VNPGSNVLSEGAMGELAGHLRRGDVLVVNDAATLPASLAGRTERGEPIEVRLAGRAADDPVGGRSAVDDPVGGRSAVDDPVGGRSAVDDPVGGRSAADGTWQAVVFGPGDWRTRTEDRPAPPPLAPGDRLRFDGLTASVTAVDPGSRRLVRIAFEAAGDEFWPRLYRAGRPVQYAHTAAPLALWDVQTAYAARPWAVEAPSAGFGLSWEVLLGVRARGIEVVPITHAAGLSSTGDARLDARFPVREAYDIPVRTARAVAAARSAGSRVIALGTTSVRALEGAAERAALDGRPGAGAVLEPGAGETDLLIGPDTPLRVVDGILTGVHAADSSHFRLLEAFAPRALLDRALALAARRGYRGHEFGDAWLILG
jgi:S-adenosylmethionine:tRNA ribosyltransferase-isomerase